MSVEPAGPFEPGPRARRVRTGQWSRSAGTKRAVLDAAAALFAEQGYDGAGIDDIVKRSGVSVGSIYHQFGGKADVFRALAAENFEQHAEASAREMKKAEAAGAGPAQVYLDGAESFLMSTWRHRDVARLMLGEQGPPGYAATRREVMVRLVQGAAALPIAGTPPGPDSAAHAVTAILTAGALEIVDAATAQKARKIARYFTGLIARLVDEAG